MINCNLIIPTFNRPYYLQRILGYYSKYGSDFNIIVADSSSSENKKLNKEIISSFKNLKILYLTDYPGTVEFYYKFADAVNHAQSKYCVFCADDDFIVPSSIKECINFMEKNPDYSVVQGLYCSHWLRKKRNGKIEFGWVPAQYHSKSITFDSPSERLKFHLANYNVTTAYGVHRTDTLRFIFKEGIESTSYDRLAEILLTALTLICGKMKILPVFYDSRESGFNSIERSYNPRPYFSLPWASFLVSDTFKTEYRRAVVCLARNLQKQIDLNSDLSTKIAEDALNRYSDSVRLGPLQKIRGWSFNLLSKTLSEPHLRSLMLTYARMNNIITNIRLRSVKREYSGFLEKNDSKFLQSLNRIKEAVIASEVYVIK